MTSKRRFRSLLGLPAAVALLFAGPVDVAAQQTGTVEGTVFDATTDEPVRGAQVLVQGTTLGAVTAQDGSFTITAVPTGPQTIQARFLGFASVSEEVQVPADQTVTVELVLVEEAIGLEGIVVTAAGEEVRRRELGNVVGNIRPDEMRTASVRNFSELIQGQTAGVTVGAAGGTVGTGARIRIRGAASASLSNDPLIVIDGVRAENSSESSSIGVGGQSFSRFEDLNPRDIENIEILKGPAATAMYGTAAAAGVIQITTRRGAVGDARWNAFIEQGVSEDTHTYPDNYNAWTSNFDEEGDPLPPGEVGPPSLGCHIVNQGLGLCQVDSLQFHNPIEATNLFGTGHNQTFGLNVTGGTPGFTYYLSGEFDNNEGVLPGNEVERYHFRGNFQSALRDDLDVSVRTGYSSGTAWLPQNDNNTLGLVSGALLGRAVDDEASRGFFAAIHPDDLLQFETGQQTDRLILSGDADWRPTDWLTLSPTLGLDNVERHDHSFVPPNTIFFGTVLPTGERVSNRIEIEQYTARLTGRTSYRLGADWEANTGFGAEYSRRLFQGTLASGAGLLPGTRSLGASATDFSVSESFTDVRTVAGWVEQRFAWRDRVYVTGALRADDDNSFGDRLDLIWFPALSASWVVAEEDWFPEVDAVSSLRVRGAIGQSGLRPGFRDAALFYEPVSVNVDGTNEPGFEIGGAGNPDLRPEVSTEIEGGFDLSLFEDRVGFEATYFHKTSRDALVSRRLAPSLGSATTRFDNVGEVVNQGVELGLNATVIDRPGQFVADIGLSGSFLDNELTDLGDVPPIIFGLGGDTQRHQEGYPLGGMWGTVVEELLPADERVHGAEGPVTRADFTLSDDHVFVGSALPTREFSLNLSGMAFDWLQFRMTADHQGGHYLNNATRFFRCGTTITCQEFWDASADPMLQAEAIAGAVDDARGVYFEKADYTRLREVSLTFHVPERFLEPVGAGGVRLTLAGRNLATWTDYTGLDPEINFDGQSNFSTAEFLSQPPLRTLTARVSVDF